MVELVDVATATGAVTVAIDDAVDDVVAVAAKRETCGTS